MAQGFSRASVVAASDRSLLDAIAAHEEEVQKRYPQQPFSVTQYTMTVWRYGFRPAQASLLALLTCMFLHGGLMHLLGNMVYLWIFGDNVEGRFGPLMYAGFYLLTGVLATLGFSALDWSSNIPLVGASGAISGVLGAYLIWFPYNQVRTVVFLVIFFTVAHVPAILVLGVYIVIDNLLPLLASRGGSIAYGAHLGGVAAGALIALLYNKIFGAVPPPRARPYVGPRRSVLTRKPLVDPREAFVKAVEEGRMVDAGIAFRDAVQPPNPPPPPAATFKLAKWLFENAAFADASTVFRYYVAHYPRDSELDRAHLALGIMYARTGRLPAAREHLLQAIDLARDPRTVHTAREELARIDN